MTSPAPEPDPLVVTHVLVELTQRRLARAVARARHEEDRLARALRGVELAMAELSEAADHAEQACRRFAAARAEGT